MWLQISVRAFGAAGGGDGDTAAELLAQQPRPGNVVGMDVGLERPGELESKLVDERASRRACSNTGSISSASRGRVGEQISVSGGLRIEELPE